MRCDVLACGIVYISLSGVRPINGSEISLSCTRTVQSILYALVSSAAEVDLHYALQSSYRSMEESVPMSIISSISNFRKLSTSSVVETELIKRYWQKIVEILGLLKLVLDEVLLPQITLDDRKILLLEELDATINDAIKLVGSWDLMMSKIYFVIPLSLPFTTVIHIRHNL